MLNFKNAIGKVMIISIIAIVLLAIAGQVYFAIKPFSDKENSSKISIQEEYIDPCLGLTGKEYITCQAYNECEDDKCYYDAALSVRHEALCYNISNSNLKTECFSKISFNAIIENAIKDKDITQCDKYENEVLIKYCQDSYNSVYGGKE